MIAMKMIDRRTHVAENTSSQQDNEQATTNIDELAVHMAATGKWNTGRALHVPEQLRERQAAARLAAAPAVDETPMPVL